MDDTGKRLRDAFRAYGEATDLEGIWTLDQFIRRYASDRREALESAALQIDALDKKNKDCWYRQMGWSNLALIAGFAGVGALLEKSLPWAAVACVVTAVGLIGRQVEKRRGLHPFTESYRLNCEHFEPLGVFYLPRDGMVQRSPKI